MSDEIETALADPTISDEDLNKRIAGWMRHAQTSDREVFSLRQVFVHDCGDFIEEDEASGTSWCGACHVVGMLVFGALEQGVPLPGTLRRLADDLPSSGLRDQISSFGEAQS